MDPIILEEDRFNCKFTYLKKEKSCFWRSRLARQTTGSQPVRLYGLPKVHKNQIDSLYRPILSMIKSYTSDLANRVDWFLKNLIPKINRVKDIFHFVDNLKCFASNGDSFFMCSFGVKSLFTNFLVHHAVDYILSTIHENNLPVNKSSLKEHLLLVCKKCPLFI